MTRNTPDDGTNHQRIELHSSAIRQRQTDWNKFSETYLYIWFDVILSGASWSHEISQRPVKINLHIYDVDLQIYVNRLTHPFAAKRFLPTSLSQSSTDTHPLIDNVPSPLFESVSLLYPQHSHSLTPSQCYSHSKISNRRSLRSKLNQVQR